MSHSPGLDIPRTGSPPTQLAGCRARDNETRRTCGFIESRVRAGGAMRTVSSGPCLQLGKPREGKGNQWRVIP